MRISYDDKADSLYIRFDERQQELENLRVTADIVLDMGEGAKIVGIEILDASKHLNVGNLLPLHYDVPVQPK